MWSLLLGPHVMCVAMCCHFSTIFHNYASFPALLLLSALCGSTLQDLTRHCVFNDSIGLKQTGKAMRVLPLGLTLT